MHAGTQHSIDLWPLEDEEAPLPATSWDEAEAVLRIGDDELKLSVELITTSHSSSRGITALKCSTLRGELDSSTPRVFGVFWMVVFDG